MKSSKAAFCAVAGALTLLFASSAHAQSNEWKMEPLQQQLSLIQEAQDLQDAERREFLCMALNIYHESRGENRSGQLAVSHVVLNRMESGRFPRSICSVIWQNGQFSWTVRPVGGIIPRDRGAWTASQNLAMEILHGITPEDPTRGATHFYNVRLVTPDWARRGQATIRLGPHAFVRMW